MIEIKNNNSLLFFLPFVVSFIVYLTTACPTLYIGDSGELSLAAYTLGIAHPPGYPLLILIGRAILLFSAKNAAHTLNVLNAIISSMSVGLAALLISHIVFPAERRKNLENVLVSVFGGLLFGFANTMWASSVGFEVYSLGILLVCLVIFFLLLYSESGRFNFLAASVFFLGLSLANHLSAVAVAPALLYIIFKSRPDFKKQAILSSLFILALALYIYIPLRSHYNPLADWNHPAALGPFIDHLTARRYQAYVTGFGPENLGQNLLRSLRIISRQFPLYLSLLGFVGLIVPSTIKKNTRILLLSILILNLFLSGLYDIPDIDQYYLPSILVLTLGLPALANFALNRFSRTAGAIAITALVLVLAFVSFIRNYPANDQSDNRLAYIYGENILKSTPQNSFLISVGDNSNSSLYYLRYVEGVRTDLEIFDPVITVESLRRRMIALPLNAAYADGADLCLALARAFPGRSYIVKEHMLARGNPFKYRNMQLYARGMVYGFGEGQADTSVWSDLNFPAVDKYGGNIDFKGMTMLANLHLGYGEDLYTARDTRKAVEQYREGRRIAEMTGEASVHNSLGIFFRRQGWPVLARNEYDSALKAGHITAYEKSNILVNLGNLEKDGGRYDKAMQYYRRALDINHDNAEAEYNLTLTLAYGALQEKKYNDAANYFEKSMRMPHSDPLINFNLGVIYDKNLNDRQKAIYYYGRLIDLLPGSSQAGTARRRMAELEGNQ
jgi:Tfp pilus assembly protein PilF